MHWTLRKLVHPPKDHSELLEAGRSEVPMRPSHELEHHRDNRHRFSQSLSSSSHSSSSHPPSSHSNSSVRGRRRASSFDITSSASHPDPPTSSIPLRSSQETVEAAAAAATAARRSMNSGTSRPAPAREPSAVLQPHPGSPRTPAQVSLCSAAGCVDGDARARDPDLSHLVHGAAGHHPQRSSSNASSSSSASSDGGNPWSGHHFFP